MSNFVVLKNGEKILEPGKGLTPVQAMVKAIAGQVKSPMCSGLSYPDQIKKVFPNADVQRITTTTPVVFIPDDTQKEKKDLFTIGFLD